MEAEARLRKRRCSAGGVMREEMVVAIGSGERKRNGAGKRRAGETAGRRERTALSGFRSGFGVGDNPLRLW